MLSNVGTSSVNLKSQSNALALLVSTIDLPSDGGPSKWVIFVKLPRPVRFLNFHFPTVQPTANPITRLRSQALLLT